METVVVEPESTPLIVVGAVAERPQDKKSRIVQWFNEADGRVYLSGSDCQRQLAEIGIEASVKHINIIKNELKPTG